MFMLCFSLITLTAHVAAHSCNNGQRVSCLAVEEQTKDSTTSTYGRSASGQPHCTSEGNKKVYCLVNHNYHKCQAGEQPCCADGSNPWHRQRSSAAADTFTCTKSVAAVEAFSAPPPIVLDDMDATNTDGVNSFEGSYAPCMKDAYKQQFHHDWAKNKGSASFTFKFEAPVSGCYMIEEYHPGSDPMCKQYMPRNAQLDVQNPHKFHEEPTYTTYLIDQASRPAQWNEVGSHMFKSGCTGRLIMRNALKEQCDAGSCFWVADAFRLTWKSQTCGASNTMASKPVMLPFAPSGKQTKFQGTLKMQVHMNHGNGQMLSDVPGNLGNYEHLIEATLAAHFSLENVDIVHIAVAGRRLSGHGDALNVEFSGFGDKDGINLVSDGLAGALQNALSGVSLGFTIVGASVEWKDFQEPAREVPFPTATGLLGMLSLVAVSLTCFLVAAVHCKKRFFGKAANVTVSTTPEDSTGKVAHVLPAEAVEASVVEVEDGAKGKCDDALEVISLGSTRSPATEPDEARSEDSKSNEGHVDV